MAAFNVNVNAGSTASPASDAMRTSRTQHGIKPAQANENAAKVQSERKRQQEKAAALPENAQAAEKNRVDLSRENSEVASVSVSEDGDVVAVSENGVRALNEEGSVTALREDENIALEEEEEEKYEPEITSLNGYTDSQVEQLYREGRISYNDMIRTQEEREEVRKAEEEEMEEMDAFNAATSDVLRRQEMEDIAISNIEDERSAEVFDAMERVSGGNALPPEEQARAATEVPGRVTFDANEQGNAEQRATKNERKAEEAGRLWDYQLRA